MTEVLAVAMILLGLGLVALGLTIIYSVVQTYRRAREVAKILKGKDDD